MYSFFDKLTVGSPEKEAIFVLNNLILFLVTEWKVMIIFFSLSLPLSFSLTPVTIIWVNLLWYAWLKTPTYAGTLQSAKNGQVE